MTNAELKALLVLVVRDAEHTMREIGDNQNPQMVLVKMKAEVRRDLAAAVLEAMIGDTITLKSYIH